jgi:hypothetical protein
MPTFSISSTTVSMAVSVARLYSRYFGEWLFSEVRND